MSHCEVDFSDASADAEPVEFYDVRTAKARKAHVCVECHVAIPVGDSHTVLAYKFEGKFASDRVCAPCQEAKAEFNYNIFGGSLWTNLEEEWDNGAHVQSCIARLTTARAKEHMRQRWLKWHDARIERQRRVMEIRKARGAVAGTVE